MPEIFSAQHCVRNAYNAGTHRLQEFSWHALAPQRTDPGNWLSLSDKEHAWAGMTQLSFLFPTLMKNLCALLYDGLNMLLYSVTFGVKRAYRSSH